MLPDTKWPYCSIIVSQRRENRFRRSKLVLAMFKTENAIILTNMPNTKYRAEFGKTSSSVFVPRSSKDALCDIEMQR